MKKFIKLLEEIINEINPKTIIIDTEKEEIIFEKE
jgi:hypothetical protein